MFGQHHLRRLAPPVIALLALPSVVGLAAGAPGVSPGPAAQPVVTLRSPIAECVPESPPGTGAGRRASGSAADGSGVSWRMSPVLTGDGSLAAWQLDVDAPASRAGTLRLPPESATRGPVAGVIAVASDDGQRSMIRLVAAADGCTRTVYRGDMVVRQAIVEPSGVSVLFHAVRRSDRADLGVWRLDPASSRPPVQVLAPLPASDPAAARVGRVWTTQLIPSADGRSVAIQSCGSERCRTRILDLATGAARRLDDAEQGDLVGLNGELAVSFRACAGLPCELVATELATGHQTILSPAAGGAATAVVDGRLVVAATVRSGGGAAFVGIDAATTRTWSLAAPAPGFALLPRGGSAAGGAEVAPGRVAAMRDDGGLPLTIDPAEPGTGHPSQTPAAVSSEVTR